MAEAGPDAVPILFDAMADEDHAVAKAASQVLEMLVHHASRPGADEEREAVATVLLAAAQSDRPVEQRKLAVRMLGFAGGDSVVAPLADLILNPDVGETARWALSRIPGEESTSALLLALPEVKGNLAAGIMLELAARGEPLVLDAARNSLRSNDSTMRVAAIETLGYVGGSSDAELLFMMIGSRHGMEQARAVRAYARIADRLLEEGDIFTPYYMYTRLVTGVELPDEARIAGLVGMGKTGGSDAIPHLMKAVLGENETLRGVAAYALIILQSDEVAPAIGREFEQAPEEVQRVFIQVLRERGGGEARKVVVDALSARSETVRIDALGALCEFAYPDDVERMLRLLEGNGPVSDEARRCLTRMGGEEITKEIGDRYRKQRDEIKPDVLKILGARRDPAALPVLLAAVADRDTAIRREAVESLGMMPDDVTVPLVLTLLDPGDEKDRELVRRVAESNAGATGEISLAKELKDGRAGALVILLLRVEDEDGGLLGSYAKDESPAVRAIALSRLADAPREADLSIFREAIRDPEEDVRREGIRGLTVLLGDLSQIVPEKGLALADEAFLAARTDEERGMVLRAYGKTGSANALAKVEPYFDDPGLGPAAMDAAFDLAVAIEGTDRARAVAVLRAVGENSLSSDRVEKVVDELRKLGAQVDFSTFGYLTRYRVAGPYSNRSALRKVEDLPPVNFDRHFIILDESHEWREVTVSGADGFLDLAKMYDRNEDCGAFVAAEVESPRSRPARLLLGSDDDVVVWVNGVKVFEFTGNRGYVPGEDGVDVLLQKGKNRIVFMVLQGNGGWGCGARVVDMR
jgi:HEAT repeat protein